MDDDAIMRNAYEKTALHRMGIPLERALQSASVRIVLEGSIKRARTQSATPASAAPRRTNQEAA